MEWVETTGRTVEEAKDRALDRLGVAEDEAELEVLEEPKVGFLGLRKGEARVRARVRPTQPRPKAERRDRNRRDRKKGQSRTEAESPAESSGSTPVAAAAPAAEPSRSPAPERPARERQAPERVREGLLDEEEHVAVVTRFVEGLLGVFGLDGAVGVHAGEDETVVEVKGAGIGLLIGPEARTAEAVGDLARSAVLRRAGQREVEGRVVVDVGGLRERRRAALEEFARGQAAAVRADGRARVLEPMGSADRKVVHDALLEADGVQTSSEGEDPHRRVVIARR